nr:hypothetical protein [Tanacetum cinerariifolium]
MSTQQDIYAAGFENHPPMRNKDNYVSWSSRIIRYTRSRPNGKIIVDSIENGPYIRRMIATPGEPDLPVPVPESFHEQTDKELTENDIKRMDADDQAIQTILLGLPEDVYAAVDKNIAANLKFLNNLQPEWKRHVTIVRQTKNLHEDDFTQIYDFRKMNQDDVNELRAERLAKTHDPLALMAHSQNSYNFLNFMQPPMTSLEYINDPAEAINAALILFAKAFQLTAPTNNNQRTSSNPCNCQIAQPGIANQNGTGNIVAARADGTGNGNQARLSCSLLKRKKQGFNFKQNNLTSFLLQLDNAPVYDADGSAEVQLNDNCYDNEIFNMFTQEEQYTDLLEPIPEPQLVPQNDKHVTYVAPSMVQSGGTVETSSAPNEETRVHQETAYRNLINQVA